MNMMKVLLVMIMVNMIVTMIVVYSAECFSTQTRGRGTGVVAAATKIAGIAAPYFITTILSYGLPWQLSVVVSQNSFMGKSENEKHDDFPPGY